MLQAIRTILSSPYVQRIIAPRTSKNGELMLGAKLPPASVHKNQFESLFPPRLDTPSKKVTDGIPFTKDFVDSFPQGEVKNAVDSSVFIIAPRGDVPFVGSGFYLSPKYVLTTRHVVDGVDDILILPVTEFAKRVTKQYVMPDNIKCSAAKVLYYSFKEIDLALLEVLDPKSDQPYVKFAEQETQRGDITYSFGILGLKTGQVVKKNDFDPSDLSTRNGTRLVTMPLRPGDSGALVTNSLGEAVGVVNYGGIPGIIEAFNRALINTTIRDYNNNRRNGDVRLSLSHAGVGLFSGLEKISQFFSSMTGQDIKSFQKAK